MIVTRLLRVRRRWQELQSVARDEGGAISAELQRSRTLSAERRQLSRPHRFVWRWYRHPLTQAYRQSRRMRRARLDRASS